MSQNAYKTIKTKGRLLLSAEKKVKLVFDLNVLLH